MNHDWRGYIEVTEVDHRLLLKTAYRLSSVSGLGVLHAKPGELDAESIDEIIARKTGAGNVTTDYVHGRAMKFTIRADKETGKSYLNLDWHDHGREATKRLVRECGVPDAEARIADAERGADEKAAEWRVKYIAAAVTLLKIVSDMGGTISRFDSPLSDWHRRSEDDPLEMAGSIGNSYCNNAGYLQASQDYKTFTITDAGREFLAEQAIK